MSLEKIAKILHVDEIRLMHGPKGVAVHVRIEKSWHSSTIDNEDLEGHRLEVIAEHLAHLADAHIHKIRDNLRKGHAAVNEAATRAALRAEAEATRRLSWSSVPWDSPYDGPIRQQVQREPVWVPATSLIEPPQEPAVVEPMPSRFHAIIAELKDL